jgi:hypothetical protein
VIRVTPFAAAVLVVGLAAGCTADHSGRASPQGSSTAGGTTSETTGGGSDETFQPSDEDRSAIRALLETRAMALSDGDREAFMDTVDTADDDLVHQQQLLFDNLQKLPVTDIGYTVDDDAGFVADDVEGKDPVFRPRVFEQVRLDIDERPVTNIVENTSSAGTGAGCSARRACPASTRPTTRPSRVRGQARSRSRSPGREAWWWWSTGVAARSVRLWPAGWSATSGSPRVRSASSRRTTSWSTPRR